MQSGTTQMSNTEQSTKWIKIEIEVEVEVEVA